MITFYAVPDGLILPTWHPTPDAVYFLERSTPAIDSFNFGEPVFEKAELQALLETPLGHLIPSTNGEIDPPPAAIQVPYVELLGTISELVSGPWESVLAPGLFDILEKSVQEALVESLNLLIVRTDQPIPASSPT